MDNRFIAHPFKSSPRSTVPSEWPIGRVGRKQAHGYKPILALSRLGDHGPSGRGAPVTGKHGLNSPCSFTRNGHHAPDDEALRLEHEPGLSEQGRVCSVFGVPCFVCGRFCSVCGMLRPVFRTIHSVCALPRRFCALISHVQGLLRQELALSSHFKGLSSTFKSLSGTFKSLSDTFKSLSGTFKSLAGTFKGRMWRLSALILP